MVLSTVLGALGGLIGGLFVGLIIGFAIGVRQGARTGNEVTPPAFGAPTPPVVNGFDVEVTVPFTQNVPNDDFLQIFAERLPDATTIDTMPVRPANTSAAGPTVTFAAGNATISYVEGGSPAMGFHKLGIWAQYKDYVKILVRYEIT